VSAREALGAALVAAVAGAVDVAVFDAPPVRGAMPHVQIEEPVLADWSAKDWAGHEARFALLVRDGGERPVRVRALLALAGDAVLAMPAGLDGWRVVTMRRVRERVVRSGAGDSGAWLGAAEFVARLCPAGV
jgi:hypothetical protein